MFEVGFPRAGVVKRSSTPPSLALRALAQAFARGEIWLHVLDALAADDIDTDCNGVITMANLTVTMTTTRRRRLSQEETEARIEMRVGHLRVLAAQTAVDCVHGAHTQDFGGSNVKTLPVPKFSSAKERAAYLAGYRHAHRERIADLRRAEGNFLVEIEKLKAELVELRQLFTFLTGRPPTEDRRPPAIN